MKGVEGDPSGMSSDERHLRELLIAAFADAKNKGKRDWQTMHLSVLKNRLLQRTERQFSEAAYGGGRMQDIVRMFPDILVLRAGPPPSAEFVSEVSTVVGVDEPESVQVALDHYRKSGDNLGVGEVYASRLSSVDEVDVERNFVNAIARWASPTPVDLKLDTIADLVKSISKFDKGVLARAVIHANLRLEDADRPPPNRGDLHYRIADSLRKTLRAPDREQPSAVVHAAMARTRERRSALARAVASFRQSIAIAAKLPSAEIVKRAHQYTPYALSGEEQVLHDVEVLLGPQFRKFCESCERYSAEDISRRATDLRRQVRRTFESLHHEPRPWIRTTVLGTVATHMSKLIDEGTESSERMMTPAIEVVGGTFKVDLEGQSDGVVFSVRVKNSGEGTAHGVHISPAPTVASPVLSMSVPTAPFDLPPHGERLLRLTLHNGGGARRVELTVPFQCHTVDGRQLEFTQHMLLEQQLTQPDWDQLLRSPPYPINPIQQKKDLYGRDAVLADLEHDVSNQTSVFLWGQKRVGKTSVLHVLAANLRGRSDIVCIILRMGELASLDEGQLAYVIATRLVDELETEHRLPAEHEFRGGLGRLVPIAESLARTAQKKMLVVIDEFDDLNSAFHVGERGRQFVKALRSLSEVGLTFMFVGSERMDSIYKEHATDLNKWVDRSLDRIETEPDCEALLTEPVAGMIEYDREAVSDIVKYCLGNPFYMHLVADRVFRRCAQEQRTFVGTTDINVVCERLARELGPTNFAHFWADEPILDRIEKLDAVSDNCLFLACVATLGTGRYESFDDIISVQAQLRVEDHEPAGFVSSSAH